MDNVERKRRNVTNNVLFYIPWRSGRRTINTVPNNLGSCKTSSAPIKQVVCNKCRPLNNICLLRGASVATFRKGQLGRQPNKHNVNYVL